MRGLDDAQLAEVAVREHVAGGRPGDDGGRAGRLEGVDALARVAVVDLDPGALVAAAADVEAVEGEAFAEEEMGRTSAGWSTRMQCGEGGTTARGKGKGKRQYKLAGIHQGSSEYAGLLGGRGWSVYGGRRELTEALDGADHVRERPLADPILGVPQADDRVGAARGQVPGVRAELDRQAGRGVALHHVLARGPGAVDAGAVVVVAHHGPEARVRQHAHLAVARRREHLAAAPADGHLVGLHGLLVAGQRGGLGGGELVEVVVLGG